MDDTTRQKMIEGLGRNLIATREGLGLTLEQVSNWSRIPIDRLRAIEEGKVEAYGVEVCDLALCYDMSTDGLLDRACAGLGQ